MNTDLLKTFLEVSKTRHFGRAADNLYLTQSAVSFRVKQLEELIGVPLFIRERNNILLTSSGERLLPHAENILAACQLALQDVGVSKLQDLQLALGGTSNVWDSFLQSILPKLAGAFPGLHVRTEVNPPQELIRALIGGRLDIIVVLDPPNIAELNVTEIGHLELVMVASQKDASLDDIPRIGHVFVDWGTAFNLQQARLFSEPLAPILHTGQSHIALEFILSHGGAAFLPKAIVAPYTAAGHLFNVSGMDTVSREVYAAYSGSSEHLQEMMPIVEMLEALELKPTDPMP